MTTFNPGDRVRLSSAANAYRRELVGNSEGTVTKAGGYYERGRVTVEWDNGSLENFPGIDEIEHVPTAEPTVSDHALRERMIEQAVQISTYEDNPAEIVARARAFEAYILGDTK